MKMYGVHDTFSPFEHCSKAAESSVFKLFSQRTFLIFNRKDKNDLKELCHDNSSHFCEVQNNLQIEDSHKIIVY